MSDTRGYGLRTVGHMLFLINLKNQNRTLVYDFDEKIWHEWSSYISGGPINEFRCDHTADDGSGYVYMLDRENGSIYKLDPDYYHDDYLAESPSPPWEYADTAITVLIRTNKIDMDSYNRKFMSAIEIVSDRYETGNKVLLSWSDDDYQTWSTPIEIKLTDDFPSHPRLGSFRRRAFQISHTEDYPLRLEALEITYDEGIS